MDGAIMAKGTRLVKVFAGIPTDSHDPDGTPTVLTKKGGESPLPLKTTPTANYLVCRSSSIFSASFSLS